MRLRGIPKVLRHHKFRPDADPHEFFYSQLLLFRPWRSEEELFPKDMEQCIRLFNDIEVEELQKEVIEEPPNPNISRSKSSRHKPNVQIVGLEEEE